MLCTCMCSLSKKKKKFKSDYLETTVLWENAKLPRWRKDKCKARDTSYSKWNIHNFPAHPSHQLNTTEWVNPAEYSPMLNARWWHVEQPTLSLSKFLCCRIMRKNKFLFEALKFGVDLLSTPYLSTKFVFLLLIPNKRKNFEIVLICFDPCFSMAYLWGCYCRH